MKKAYRDKKLSIESQIFYIEKDYNEFKIQYIKQSEEEILKPRAVKTTLQMPFEKGSFDGF